MYGHDAQLNFNQKGIKHKTTIGAIISFLVIIFYLYYAWTNIEKLIYHGDNYETTYKQLVQTSSAMENVYYTNSDLISFFVLSK